MERLRRAMAEALIEDPPYELAWLKNYKLGALRWCHSFYLSYVAILKLYILIMTYLSLCLFMMDFVSLFS